MEMLLLGKFMSFFFIQDIYEATEFHPQAVSAQDSDVNDKIYTCAIKFNILEISARMYSMYGSYSSKLFPENV